MAKRKTTKLVLELDEQDYQHVIGAMRRREIMGCAHIAPHDTPVLPDGDGNREGRLLAEICRGWAEAICGWRWIDGEPMNPDDRMKMRKDATV